MDPHMGWLAERAILPGSANEARLTADTPQAGSLNTSMAVERHSRNDELSVFSGTTPATSVISEVPSNAPSLSKGSSAPSSSADTELGRHLARQPLVALDPNGHTVAPVLRESCLHGCILSWLDCGYTSDDTSEWKLHCLSHLHRHEPPHTFCCPLCGYQGGSFPNGYVAWDARLNHIAMHNAQGQDLSTARPDFELVRFLFKKKLISNDLYMSLKSSLPRNSNQITSTHERRHRVPQGWAFNHPGAFSRF